MNKPTSEYLETYYEIVAFITACEYQQNTSKLIDGMIKLKSSVEQEKGIGGLYELAEDLTDKFMKQYEDYTFDGDYFEKLEEYFDNMFA